MAQPDPSLTPEKRLLELIEEPDAHNKNTGDEAKKTGKGALFSSGYRIVTGREKNIFAIGIKSYFRSIINFNFCNIHFCHICLNFKLRLGYYGDQGGICHYYFTDFWINLCYNSAHGRKHYIF